MVAILKEFSREWFKAKLQKRRIDEVVRKLFENTQFTLAGSDILAMSHLIIVIIIQRKQITRGRYITKHLLTFTPAGAESDLNAAADGA